VWITPRERERIAHSFALPALHRCAILNVMLLPGEKYARYTSKIQLLCRQTFELFNPCACERDAGNVLGEWCFRGKEKRNLFLFPRIIYFLNFTNTD
jgi:hypothetical protein